jgi:hypothetical protein
MPDLARELVLAKPNAIYVTGTDALRAASVAANTVPIVSNSGARPVRRRTRAQCRRARLVNQRGGLIMTTSLEELLRTLTQPATVYVR